MLLPFRQADYAKVRISSPYGERIHPISKERSHHRALDFAMPSGTPLIATEAARVKYSRVNSGGESKGYGYYLVLEHEETNKFTLYAHLKSRSLLNEGARVKAGDFVAYSGNTGSSTGPHLHFEIHQGAFKFPSQISRNGGPDDPTIDPLTVYPGLSDYVGKNNLAGYEIDKGNGVKWVGEIQSLRLNVRNAPTTKGSKIIETLQRGDILTVFGSTTTGGKVWLRVGKNEWVSNARNEYVDELHDREHVAEVQVDNLNVRQGPGTQYERVGQKHKGDKVNVFVTFSGENMVYDWLYIGDGLFIANEKSGEWVSIDQTLLIKDGDMVKVKKGADWATGESMHSFVYTRMHQVNRINKTAGTALLKYGSGYAGHAYLKDLIKI